MRANPHTLTSQAIQNPNPDRLTRHHASESSHNATRPHHVNGLEPSQPPLCEPILAQRRSRPTIQPNATTQPVTMRANPHTTTTRHHQTNQTTPPNRHRASQSSHSDPPSHPEAQSRPPHPPSCEPILTQCRSKPTTQPTPATQTAIVRANPHTTPHPPVHGAQPRASIRTICGSAIGSSAIGGQR